MQRTTQPYRLSRMQRNQAAMPILNCPAGVALFLLIVGIVSGTVLRHAIQIIPLVACMIAIRQNDQFILPAALGLLVFWLMIVVLIWLILLGIARVVSGHYTSAEVLLTIIMAFISLYGIFRFARQGLKSISSVLTSMIAFAIHTDSLSSAILFPCDLTCS